MYYYYFFNFKHLLVYLINSKNGVCLTGPWNRKQPIPGLRLHLIPRASHLCITRQHRSFSQGRWRPSLGTHMRHHCGGRETPRNGLLKDSRQTARNRPNWNNASNRRYNEEKDNNASSLDVDGEDPRLFEHFAAVAQRIGVYASDDYADIVEALNERWGLEKLEGLSDEGRRVQEFVCNLAPRIRKLQERAEERAKKMGPQAAKFSWIFNREISL